MLKFRRVLCCLAIVWGFWVPGLACAAAVPAADTLLPATTVGFVSATSSTRLKAHWSKTQIGKFLADPIMKPFQDDLRAQIQSQWSGLSDRLGIGIDDLRGVPTGESALALIEAERSAEQVTPATVMLLDVTGNLDAAQKVLDKARRTLIAKGATPTQQTVQGVSVYIFNVPLPAGQQVAAAQGGGAASVAANRTIYFLTQNFFCACDNLSVVQGILEHLVKGGATNSLSTVVGYQMVMKRCAADTPVHSPDARWFVYPQGYAEVARAATPSDKRRKGKTIVEIMHHQGYGAVQGVGGYVDVPAGESADGYEIMHRTAIYAPPPYVESMRMFVFPNSKNFTPQTWVGRDNAAYLTLYVDILNAFDNFGPLYDEIIGEKGVWTQTLDGMKNDPGGPQIDLRKELIQNLGTRVSMVADYNLPITTTSERLLWAIETRDDAAVAKAIEKCVKNDPTMKKRLIEGHVVWEIVEEEDAQVPSLSVDVPSLTPKKEGPKDKSKPEDKDEDKEEREAHFLPHGAITVANGHLIIATHLDFIKKVLQPIDAKGSLATQDEFLKVWDAVNAKLGVKEQCARSFSWTDQEVRTTYELIRQGKMPQSESLLGRALNSLADSGKKGVARKQRIDGSKLPDFEVVRRALGPATLSASSEANGWFIKGVLVTK